MKIVSAADLDMDSVAEHFEDVVVVPTETVYGLGASIYKPHAICRIFELKNRPADNPLIVHVSSVEMLRTIIDGPVSEECQRVIDRFWPGPLSLLFRANSNVSAMVRGGLGTVAVRMPRNSCLLQIIERVGPIAAPSANVSGRPSPTTIQHVLDDFDGKIGLVIDGGPCSVGLESTVASFMDGRLVVLRPGRVTVKDLEEVAGPVEVRSKTEDGKALCPGQKYRHYSPNARLVLFKGEAQMSRDRMCEYIRRSSGARIGIAAHSDLSFDAPTDVCVFDMGQTKGDICRNLFSALRELDRTCDVILVAGVDADNEGLAIMDRLEKAASEVVAE